MSLDPNGPPPAEPSPGGAAVADVGGEMALMPPCTMSVSP